MIPLSSNLTANKSAEACRQRGICQWAQNQISAIPTLVEKRQRLINPNRGLVAKSKQE